MSTLRIALSASVLGAALGTAALVPVPAGATIVPACGNSSITVTASAQQGATGHGNFVLHFRNRTTHTCSLTGYPGLDAMTAQGSVLAHARRTLYGFTGGSHHGVQTIVVAPGHYASADVEWMNFNPATSGPCAFSSYVLATPANTSHTVRVARSVSKCDLQVHPTVLGTSGNG